MSRDVAGIKHVDPADALGIFYRKQFADCIILTHDHKILLQQRPEHLSAFGGHIESDESVIDALTRELHEELGARVCPQDVLYLGALTEDFSQHQDIVHLHFWHDKDHTITGCYEWAARDYHTVSDVLAHPKMMDYLRWGLYQCQDQMLLK